MELGISRTPRFQAHARKPALRVSEQTHPHKNTHKEETWHVPAHQQWLDPGGLFSVRERLWSALRPGQITALFQEKKMGG